MEAGTNQHKIGLFIAEASGTAVFLTAIFFSALYHTDQLTVAVGVGGGLFIAITCFGKETGGHFNPAVTTGYFLCIVRHKKKYLGNFIILILAQILGGLFAGCILYFSSNKMTPILMPEKNNLTGSFVVEILFTFIFLLIIYCVKSRNVSPTSDSMLGALCVSSALTLMVLYGGQISGACYNPAVGIAINLWSTLSQWNGMYLEYVYIYLFAPIIGGCLAGLLVNKTLDKKIQHSLTAAELKCTVDVESETDRIATDNDEKDEDINDLIIDKSINEPILEQKNIERAAFSSFS